MVGATWSTGHCGLECIQDIGQKPVDIHPSEWAWANVNFNKVLTNNTHYRCPRTQVQGHLSQNYPSRCNNLGN